MLKRPLFKGKLIHPATQFVGVPVNSGAIGAHIWWKDGTSSAAITLELTSLDSDVAPLGTAGSAGQWQASGVAVTGPTAAGAGGSMVNVENCRQSRARLKIVTAADTDIEISEGLAGNDP